MTEDVGHWGSPAGGGAGNAGESRRPEGGGGTSATLVGGRRRFGGEGERGAARCPGAGPTEGVSGDGPRCGRHPPRPPLHLSLVAFLLMLWATPSLGGMCWTSKTKSGHCKELISHRMGREDCCSAGGATTAWSAKELDPGSLFFWRALGGGVPCQACKETCTGVKCGEGKRCIIRKGRPKCACALDCRHGKGSNKGQRGPVCGSDGRSYTSVCRLRKRSCRKKSSDLTIAYYGQCQRSCDRIRCPDGKQCLLDQRLTPHCVKCRRNCPLLIPAPFASSSHTSSTSLLVSSSSSPSSASSAALAASATARHRMVCGVDGVTYLSACHLREAACRRGKAIPIAYKGRCKKAATCRTVHCREGQSCLTEPLSGRPRCVTCSQRCPRNNRKTTAAPAHANSSGPPHESGNNSTMPKKTGGHNRGWSSWGPLCGSNDQTYDSWCQMLKDACATGFVISTKHFGSCDAEAFVGSLLEAWSPEASATNSVEVTQKLDNTRCVFTHQSRSYDCTEHGIVSVT